MKNETITVKEYAKREGISVQAAHKRLNKKTLPENVAEFNKLSSWVFLVKMK